MKLLMQLSPHSVTSAELGENIEHCHMSVGLYDVDDTALFLKSL
jgi:hypothetical protein